MTSAQLKFASFKHLVSAVISFACISTLALTEQLQSQPTPAPSSASPIVRVPMDLFAGRVPFITIATKGGRLLHVILDTGANDDILNARVVSEVHLHVLNPQRVEQPGGAIEMGNVDPLKIRL